MIRWLTLLLVAPTLLAQAETVPDTVATFPGVAVAVSVEPIQARLGDVITVTVSVTYDEQFSVIPPPRGIDLGALELRSYRPLNPEATDEGRTIARTVFELVSFELGSQTVPQFPVLVRDRQGTESIVLSDSVRIEIISQIAPSDLDTANLKPVMPQATAEEFEEYVATDWRPLIGIAILALLLTAIAIWWYRRRRETSPLADSREPWEIAFEDLARLQNLQLPTDGKFREYYFGLTEIIKAYLGRITSVDHALEMTTDELRHALPADDLVGEEATKLLSFFTRADLVKFARQVPSGESCRDDFDYTHSLIERLRVTYQRRHATIETEGHVDDSPPQHHERVTPI